MTGRRTLAAFALLLAACTQGTALERPAPRRAGGFLATDVLLLGGGGSRLTLGTAAGAVLFDGRGVASPDRSRIYVTSGSENRTVLETRDARGGEVLSTTRIAGRLGVRVVAGSNAAVALMEPLPRGADPWTPVPRARTTLVVGDPKGAEAPRRYELTGNFEPEAFSTDDSTLFLIQYLPAEAPVAYRVTALDLSTGEVSTIRGRYDSPPERMPGTRLAQVHAPGGGQLYTLYSNEPEAYATGLVGHHGDQAATSFIHVLDLEGGWAHCAGVPRDLWGRPAGAQALAPSPDGARLYIVDIGIGLVAIMDTRSLKIVRTARFSPHGGEPSGASAKVSPDGRKLLISEPGDSSTLLVLDAETLRLEFRRTIVGSLSDIAVSRDGLRLYLSLADRVVVADARSGEEVGALPFPGGGSILSVASPS